MPVLVIHHCCVQDRHLVKYQQVNLLGLIRIGYGLETYINKEGKGSAPPD